MYLVPLPPAVGRLVLLGRPVAHSLSPRFQNAALEAAGFPVRYEAVDVGRMDLPILLRDLANIRGAGNVTVPYKAVVGRICVGRTPIAEAVGAVNTFWFDAGRRLIGDNTDVGGFNVAARALVDPERTPQRVALIGAGGSAAAVAAAVAEWPGAAVRIHSRTPHKAAALAERFMPEVQSVENLGQALAGATLIVNATPLGLHEGDAFPVPIDRIPPGAAALDLAYRPERTAWIRAARAAGVRADDGLAMLVEQGALAFARWFGEEPDRAVMWRALDAVLERRAAGP